MKVSVTKDNVIITEGSAVFSGEVGVNECVFSLPELFEGLTVTASFNNIPVPVVNGKCIIPSLDQGTATLGVYAYSQTQGETTLMYSPKPTVFYVERGSFSEESNSEAKPEISVYEQYCNMIKNEYEEIESAAKQGEALREQAEQERKRLFLENEEQRERQFNVNEQKRSSSSLCEYTNLLKDFAEMPDDASSPASCPARKKGYYYNKDISGFSKSAVADSYIFEAAPGERFNVSGFFAQTSVGVACSVTDENFNVILSASILNSRDALGGTYAMPEGSKYVILNAVSGSSVPVVVRASEEIIESKSCFVPYASKLVVPQENGNYHLCYDSTSDSFLTSKWALASFNYYANGLYPLKQGVEYVVSMPDINDDGYHYKLLFFCDENLKINRIVNHHPSEITFDEHGKYVFIPTQEDAYLAINSVGTGTGIQLGENRARYIGTSVDIGNAQLDGKHSISLKDMGVIDRSIDKKLVAYGDSITLGVGVNYVGGEERWTDYLTERYNISQCINMGVGYSSIAMKESFSEKPMSHDDRLDALVSESPDIVTILGGANDYIFNIPIGTKEDIESKNRYTFMGAYAYIIDRILSAKPDTIIIILGMFKNAFGAYGQGKGRYPLEEYSSAAREIADCFGLPFVDLNECGFNKYNFSETSGVLSADGIHPNAQGTRRIAMVICKWLDSFKGTIF